MVIDFGDLKQAMLDVIDKNYDHGFCIWREDPRAMLLKQANDLRCFENERFHLTEFIPTAENLAKHWFYLLRNVLSVSYGIKLYSLQVFETPGCSATYTEGI